MDNVIEELSITSLLAQMRRIPDDRYYYSIYATFEDGNLKCCQLYFKVTKFVAHFKIPPNAHQRRV